MTDILRRQAEAESQGGVIMNHLGFHEVRGSCLLMVSFAMLTFICAVAMLSALMRPTRWADRQLAKF